MQIAIIGAGKMGGAMAQGLENRGYEVLRIGRPMSEASATRHYDRALACPVVFLCVKPKDMRPLARRLGEEANRRGEKPLFVSVAAGLRLGALEQDLGSGRVARAMPNLAAASNQALVPFCAAKRVSRTDQAILQHLLDALGGGAEVREEQLDLITAISGSGPAYFLDLADLLREEGVRQGLDAKLADQMARRALGSAAALALEKEPMGEQVRRIATPGGITQAGLDALREQGLARAARSALEKARARSKQMGDELGRS